MEIAAIAKSGLHIYSFSAEQMEGAKEQGDGKPVVSLPCAGSAFGYAWSTDGSKLASCDQGTARVWDTTKGYKQMAEIAPVGESGGARAMLWSPRSSFLFTFEKYDQTKCPENMHVWDMRMLPNVKKVRSLALGSYASGKITESRIQWTPDETLCLELIAGEGIVVLDADLNAGETRRFIPEPNASEFSVAPAPQNDGFFVAMYVPEAANSWGAWDLTGHAGEVRIYHVSTSSDEIKKISYQLLPRKLNGVELRWNSEGNAVLAQANSDVDETGESYFGTSTLYWLKTDGKSSVRISGPEDGLVQDVQWAPMKNEFLMIIGMMPATTKLFDGKTGKMVKDGTLGTSRRNTIQWNPFGRMLMVGGFGALPGDLDFFDRPSGETLCSFRAALTVQCCWAPSGRHFLTCTTAPRMNEDNQISVWHSQTGELILKVDFKPEGALRTGGGSEGGRAAADSGAMLWAASWKPDNSGTFKDQECDAAPKGTKRVKGLPADSTASGGAYRPKGGAGFNSISAMMRGELAAPDAAGAPGADRGWSATPAMTWQEEQIKQQEWIKEKKVLEKKQKADDLQVIQDAKDEKSNLANKFKDQGKRLKEAKAELAELEKLKDKEWDELTEEDDAALEGEFDLMAEIRELEKKCANV